MNSGPPSDDQLGPFLDEEGWAGGDVARQLGAGHRHKVFLLERGGRRAVLKLHEPPAAGRRDAFVHEVLMHGFYAGEAPQAVPAMRGHQAASRAILFEFVEGAGVPCAAAGEVTDMAHFLVQTNRPAVLQRAREVRLPGASDQGSCAMDHWQCAGARLASLAGLPMIDEVTAKMRHFVESEVRPFWSAQRPAAEPAVAACLSPSDFGFHNVIRRTDGSLCFLDFEHAGWDDPAKLVADFILQPQAPLSAEMADLLMATLDRDSSFGPGLRPRVLRLLPVQKCKWTVIILNVFSRGETCGEIRSATLAKAERYWQTPLPSL